MFKIWEKKYCFDFKKIQTWKMDLIELEIIGEEDIEEEGTKFSVYICKVWKNTEKIEKNFAHLHLKASKKEVIDTARTQAENAIKKSEEFVKKTRAYIKQTNKFLKKLEEITF